MSNDDCEASVGNEMAFDHHAVHCEGLEGELLSPDIISWEQVYCDTHY